MWSAVALPMLPNTLGTSFRLLFLILFNYVPGFSRPLYATTSYFLTSMTKYSITWSSKVCSLFMLSFDELQTIHSGCALGPDLALLPHGDMTEVGEKGK